MPKQKTEEVLKILGSRFQEIADLVAENARLKDELAAFQVKQNNFVAEPSNTPLTAEVEDIATAGDWAAKPDAKPTKRK